MPSFRAQGCRFDFAQDRLREESRLPESLELTGLSNARAVDPGFLTTQTPFGMTDLYFFANTDEDRLSLETFLSRRHCAHALTNTRPATDAACR